MDCREVGLVVGQLRRAAPVAPADVDLSALSRLENMDDRLAPCPERMRNVDLPNRELLTV
jgi:hypothetical protein